MTKELFLFFLIITLIYFFIRKSVIKHLGISKKFIYVPVNDSHKRLETIVTVTLMLVCLIPIFLIADYDSLILYGNLAIFSGPGILFAFRAFIEWKLDKTTKRFLVSIIDSIAFIIMALGVLFFMGGK